MNVVHNYFTQYMSAITWTTELDLRNTDNKDDDYDDDDDDNAADDDDDDDDNDNKCSVKYLFRIFCLWYVTCRHYAHSPQFVSLRRLQAAYTAIRGGDN